MEYSAAALAAASRPVVLTIGRASERRGVRWLSGWWVRRCRTWTARPLSVPQMLHLQAAGADPVAALAAMRAVLRQVLPRRWWYAVVGDPVRLILSLPTPLLQAVTKALVTVPDTERDVSREVDPFAELRQLQRHAVTGKRSNDGVSLAAAAMGVRAVYGDAWYYNPHRWPTSDGYAPFAVAIVEHAGMQALEVRRRLEIAEGTMIAHAKPHERVRLRKLAYPGEVS